MKKDKPRATAAADANLAASVRQRLLNLREQRPGDFNVLLSRYASERLLYRLACSDHAGEFVLKGALLFALWLPEWHHRPTRDLDLLGFGEDSEARLTMVFQGLCRMTVPPDGLAFDAASVRVTEIREGQEYGGRRVTLLGRVGNAVIPVQVDVGFGDAISPAAEEITYPTLLPDFPAPRLRAYPRETVVAEKLQAAVSLGRTNTRMKDFYDLVVLARRFPFAGPALVTAIRATFVRRRTAWTPGPDAPLPLALTGEFGRDPDKATQWRAFLRRSGLGESGGAGAPAGFAEVMNELRSFLTSPYLAAGATGDAEEFARDWPPGGPWTNVRAADVLTGSN